MFSLWFRAADSRRSF